MSGFRLIYNLIFFILICFPLIRCPNIFCSSGCRLKLPNVDCTGSFELQFENGTCYVNSTFIGLWDYQTFQNVTGIQRTLASEEYFKYVF